MTDWTQEEDEAFNEVEKHSNLGKQILREIGQPYHFEKREWVGLTDEEMKKTWYEMQNIMGWYSFEEIAKAIEAKLKEKNEKT
jgi:hypothetical protein